MVNMDFAEPKYGRHEEIGANVQDQLMHKGTPWRGFYRLGGLTAMGRCIGRCSVSNRHVL